MHAWKISVLLSGSVLASQIRCIPKLVKTWVLWLTLQNPVLEGWSLTWRTPLYCFQLLWAICEFLHELFFPWWPEMTWINYDTLCGKHCLQSVLPHFSLLIYWPPTPLSSFCSCPNFPISSICFKIKKLLFGRQYKHCTSTDVFSVSARSGHTLMRFCLAPFLVWRDWRCMNIFILLLSSFLSFFSSFPLSWHCGIFVVSVTYSLFAYDFVL